MNKSIALLIIGVISLAMFLIMINQVATTSTPPLVGVQNPLPQTNLPSSTALNPPTVPASTPAPVQQSAPPANTSSSMLSAVNSPSTTSALTAPTQSLSSSAPEPAHVSRPAPERSTPSPSVKSAPPASEKENPAPAPKVPPKAAGPKTISKITVAAAGDGATVRIVGTTDLAYKTMHLKSPDRLVVDLDGIWAVKAPGVPANKAITNVRIGKQNDKTRIVIDLGRTPGGVNFIKINNETLEVRVK